MAQFDVYRNAVRASARRIPYLLDVQSNLLADLKTRVVVPLIDPRAEALKPLPHVNPSVEVDGRTYILLTQEIAGVSIAVLGSRVVDLADRRYDILRAIDALWSGI